MNIQRDIFPKKTATSQSKPDYALPTFDQRASEKTTSTFTAGTDFTIPAGAAGTEVKILLSTAPILGNFGRTGNFGNSSFAWGGAAATTFDTEVAFVADASNRGGDASGLANGEYMIDYEAGVVYAKKADAGTTGTCAYTFLSTLGGGGGSGDVVGPASSTDNAVALFDGTTGKLLQNSPVIVDPSTGDTTGQRDITASRNILAQDELQSGVAGSAAGTVRLASGDDPLGGMTLSVGTTGATQSQWTLPVAGIGEGTVVGTGVTQTLEKKTLTSPVIDTQVTGSAVLDDDTFATASATTVATSESIKAYVDSLVYADATVGTGGQYATISAALAASKSRLLVVGNVTESSACAVPSNGLVIYVNKGVNLDMGANQFTFAGNYNATVIFQAPSSRLTWAFTAATNTRLFATGANTGSIVTILGPGTLDNNSTQSGCYVQDVSSIAVYENVWYEPPNVANCGIYLGNSQSRATNIWITAPGTTATDVFRTDAGIGRNIRLSGTFTNANDAVTVGGDAGVIDGITNNGNAKIAISGGKLLNVAQDGGTLNIDVDSSDQSQIVNLFHTAGTLAIASGSNDNRFVNCEIAAISFGATSAIGQFTNCEIGGTITVASSGSQFTATAFSGATTFSGDGNIANGCTFSSTLTISDGSDGNIINGIFNGNVSITGDQNRISGRLGTSVTCTLNSGAEYNNIDVTIDQAVTDSSGNATNAISELVY